MPDLINKYCYHVKNVSGVILLILAALFFASFAQADPINVDKFYGAQSLMPYTQYLLDESGNMNIQEASSLANQNLYKPLSAGIPLEASGKVWLRFSLINNTAEGQTEGDGHPLLLRLGESAPVALVYLADKITQNTENRQWTAHFPQGEAFIMPDPGNLPTTVYVSLNGVPGLWFNPLLATPEENIRLDDRIPLNLIFMGLLGLGMVILLGRGISDNEEWRFWGATIVFFALASAIFGNFGVETPGIYLTSIPPLLAPGLAAILYPHLARHMLKSQKHRGLDFLLLLLSIPGVCAALLPFLPDFSWSIRLLPLTPLLLLPLLLVAMLGVLLGRKGSFSLLLFILAPVCGAAAAGYFLYSGRLEFGPELTTAGYALGALLLAIAPAIAKQVKSDFFPLPDDYVASEDLYAKTLDLQNKNQDELKVIASMMEEESKKSNAEDNINSVANKTGDPAEELFANLQEAVIDTSAAALPSVYVSDEKPAEHTEEGATPNTEDLHTPKIDTSAWILGINEEGELAPILIKSGATHQKPALKNISFPSLTLKDSRQGPEEYLALARLESALRTPYESLMESVLELKSSGPENFTQGLEEPLRNLGLLLENMERIAKGEAVLPEEEETIFNLTTLVRSIHDQVQPVAEARNVALSWFVSPSLPLAYKGKEDSIKSALRYLMQGAVETASSGAIQLTARPAVGGNGNIVLFQLLDSGMQLNDIRRPSGWLSKVWELACSSNGSFSIEFVPDQGTAVNFALQLVPISSTYAEPPILDSEPAKATEQVTDTAGSNKVDNPAKAQAAADPTPEPAPLEQNLAEEQKATTTQSAAEPAEKQTRQETVTATVQTEEAGKEPVTAEAQPPNPEKKNEAPAVKEIASVTETTTATDNIASTVQDGLLRDRIVVADTAASGRRIISRRLEGMPHSIVEAKNTQEIIKACSRNRVGLIILDADLNEADVKKALRSVNENAAQNNELPVPSLCLISHESQRKRMERAGCTECIIKSVSRTLFREVVLRLAPHPYMQLESNTQEPESNLTTDTLQATADAPQLASNNTQVESAPQQSAKNKDNPTENTLQANAAIDKKNSPAKSTDTKTDSTATEKTAAPSKKKKKRSSSEHPVRPGSMFDMIVEGLAEKENNTIPASTTPDAPGTEAPVVQNHKATDYTPLEAARKPEHQAPLAGTENEFMDADMLPLIPGLLIVLDDSLRELVQGVETKNTWLVEEVSGRMCSQGRTFGLAALERMASCVQRAAAAKDIEAMAELAEELQTMGQRYKNILSATHEAQAGAEDN